MKFVGEYDDQKQHRAKTYQMWQEIFDDPVDFADYYYKEVYKQNRVYLMWNQEKRRQLCGMIHLNPYEMKLGEQQQPLDYIVGVAVDQKMRRCGIMRQMLHTVMETMRQEKKPFTYLMPANEDYYLPFDFRFVFERFLWTPKTLTPYNHSITFVPYEEEKHFELLHTYCNRFFETIDIVPVRTKRYLERTKLERQSEKGELLVLWKEERCVGYLTYAIEDTTCIVQEIVTEEKVDEVLSDFWIERGFSKQKAWLDFFHDKRGMEEVEKKAMIMARIVDVESMMKLVTSKTDKTVIVQIDDPFLTENSGVYEWSCIQGETSVQRTTKQPEKTVTIAQLTDLIFEKKRLYMSEIV